MSTVRRLAILLCLFVSPAAFSQQKKVLRFICEDSNEPVENVSVSLPDTIYFSDAQGIVDLEKPSRELKISITHPDREAEVRYVKNLPTDTTDIVLLFTEEAQLRAWAAEDVLLNEAWKELDAMYSSGQYASEINVNGNVPDHTGTFPGGKEAIGIYLRQKTRYPEYCARNEITGKVIVRFVVQKDGQVTNVVIVKGAHPGLDREALRVVRAMPLWEPGTEKGKPVICYYSLPITFGLN